MCVCIYLFIYLSTYLLTFITAENDKRNYCDPLMGLFHISLYVIYENLLDDFSDDNRNNCVSSLTISEMI